MQEQKILIIGTIASGKTTFFNKLVRKYSIKPFYFPGTDSELRQGRLKIGKINYLFFDTPGIKNLIPTTENELITIRQILEIKPDKIIFVTNEEHMEQNIHLLIQLAELGIPFIINFYRKNDFVPITTEYNYNKIRSIFHTEVVHTTPILKKGMNTFKKKLGRIYNTRWVGSYSKEIDDTISEIEDILRGKINLGNNISLRFIAVMLILKNQVIIEWLRKTIGREQWLLLKNYLTRKTKKEHAYKIAKHWETLTTTILAEVTIKDRKERKPIYLKILNRYSLLPLWDIGILAIILYLWYKAMVVIGSRFLVNILYNGLFGKYLQPLFFSAFNFLFGQNIISDFFVGPYGIINIGLTYALSVILPTVFVFFFIFSLLDEIGYIPRISLSLNRLLRFFGINGYAFPPLATGCSCKIVAALKTRKLETKKDRILTILILTFAIPCISQLSIIANLLSIIPSQYTLIYFLLIFFQLIVLVKIYSFFHRGSEPRLFAVNISPLKVPEFKHVLGKATAYARWFLRETLPLLLYGSLFLYVIQKTGLLNQLYLLFYPATDKFLNLPSQFTDAVIIGLFRKDAGAVYLYDLANNGFLNSIQVLVSTVFMTLSFSCFSYFLVLIKEFGWRFSCLLLGFSTFYAFAISALLNFVLRF